MSNIIEMDSDLDMSSLSDASSLEETWVLRFCSKPENQYFCDVSEGFMSDDFNLTGLSQLVPRYKEALELILDLEHETEPALPDLPAINQSGELLYGLIHQRYIVTKQGLQNMIHKYRCNDFGTCPRVLCEDTGLIPMGRHDMPGFETVRLYCPCCRDIYLPPYERFLGIDGAFFGSSFPGMLLDETNLDGKLADIRKRQFHLRVFGFKISKYAAWGPRMGWLRETPESEDYLKLEDGVVEDPEVLG